MTARVEVDPKSGRHRILDTTTGPVEEANAFLQAVATRGLSPLTVRAYAFDLVALYRWMASTDRSLAELTQSDLLDFIRHERGRGAHPRSINRRLIACQLLHRFWHPNGLVATSGTSLPAPHYRSSGRDRRIGMHILQKKREVSLRVKTPQKLVTPLSRDQVRAFLRSLRRYRDHAIVHMMLLCGLRSCEILQLDRRDVSLLECRVRVSGKGNKERIVPLADLASTSIEQYLKHERPPDCADEALFVCLQGKRRGRGMTPAGLRSLFRGRRKSMALTNVNPHRFRHTFGADMARSGLVLPVLQKLMGHANPETTLGYINLSMTDIADAYRVAAAEIQKHYDPAK
jgi:site-specific recombinase XerD